jgi:hypothetical protein
MKRFGLVLAAVAAVAALPATASANHGTTCDYTSGQAVTVPPGSTGPIVVYEGNGMSGQALAAVGVCVYSPTTVGGVTVAGGTVEAGAGTPAGGPGAYAIVDGDNANQGDPTGSGDGYIGVSNFETGAKGNCDGGGTGTNSGGCFEIKNVTPPLPVPLLACGNTSGPTWDNTGRDGCAIP